MESSTFLNALISLFVMVDPIGAAIIFHTLAPNDTKKRLLITAKAVVIAFILLALFGKYGNAFLSKLDISIESMRIAGGLLLFYTAFYMIIGNLEVKNPLHEHQDITIYPMTIPLLAGPGSLTLIILLFSDATNTQQTGSIIMALFIVMVITGILMAGSQIVKKLIGKTGDEVLRRFLGVILAALSIQFIYEGIANLAMN